MSQEQGDQQEETETMWWLSDEVYYSALAIWLVPSIFGFLALVVVRISSKVSPEVNSIPFLWFLYLSLVVIYLSYRRVALTAKPADYRNIYDRMAPIYEANEKRRKIEQAEMKAQGEQLDDDSNTNGNSGVRTRGEDRIRNEDGDNHTNRRGVRLPSRKTTL